MTPGRDLATPPGLPSPDHPTIPPSLTADQARHLLAVFQHVAALLQSAETAAGATASPFSKTRADLAASEVSLLRSAIDSVRTEMARTLHHLGLGLPPPSVSARWHIEVGLGTAEIALSDLGGGTLSGYGPVSVETAGRVRDVAEHLRLLLRRATAVLHEHEAGGLAERLARIPGVAGQILRALEQLSTERAISEVRPLIAAAVERAEATTFDVGVFGRVSSGKSSLINALAGGPILPVGATPVTAVPLRIRRGAPAVRAVYQDGHSDPIRPDAIASVATEEENPGNRLGVRSVEVDAPGMLEGLCLLDTPGVGSLTTAGPAQAFAWLPRCDLGLVLIAAGTPVSPDDVALVSGLAHAGVRCRVLVSKADLLHADEVERMTTYVARELASAIGKADVPVGIVSTRPALSATVDALQREVLAPLISRRAGAARQALSDRLRRLLAAVDAAVAGRETGTSSLELSSVRAEALARVHAEVNVVAESAEAILAAAGSAVVDAWARGEGGAAAAAGAITAGGAGAVDRIRAAVDAAGGSPASFASSARLPPIFDPPLLRQLPDLSPPRFGRSRRVRSEAYRILAPLRGDLENALTTYASRLDAWGRAGIQSASNSASVDAGTDIPTGNATVARLLALLDSEPLGPQQDSPPTVRTIGGALLASDS